MATRKNEERRKAFHKRRKAANEARAIEYRKEVDQNSILSSTYDRLEPYIGGMNAKTLTSAADWFLPGYGAAATGEDSLDILREADSFGDYAMGGALGALSLAEMVPIVGKAAKPAARALKGATPDIMRFMADEAGDVGLPMLGHNGGPASALDTVDLPAGSREAYRGAAPNRTTPYERYNPPKPPERTRRLVESLDNPEHSIHGMVRENIAKGKTLDGSDWYNTEELRDWAIEELGSEQGDKFWRDYMMRVGNTSTGSNVPSNL